MATQYGQYGDYGDYGDRSRQGAAPGAGAGERRRHRLPAVLRAPVEARAWREFTYVLLSLPISIVLFTFAVTMLSVGAGLLVTFLGVPVLAAGLAACRGLGSVERARARGLLGLDVAAPEPLRPRGKGAMSWMGAVLRSGTSWRHVLYAVLHMPWAVFSFTVAITFWVSGWATLTYPLWFWLFPLYGGQDGLQLYGDDGHRVYLDNPFEITVTALLGLLITLATPWIVRALTTVDRVMVHGLLGPSRLASRVVELESDRGVVVDTAAADLRRIERDLHDGAQARLVALAMDLGLAKEKLREDPREAARMVDEAHGEVKTALQELRDLARGIHPAVLTDRGLDAALSSVASRCTVPVQVEVDLVERPAAAIEGIAYFTVSELLQNVSKHSGARSAAVDVWRVEERLMVQVSDDGVGGADASGGSGLAGLAGRLDAVDGILVVD
ncbi:sensor domain-containing protein, partial [Streptomyces sp. ID05-39B]|uniref:sensor histidine kinase n=1 Tax=Streptomyces sp. ID05-39B TaxID=3028664 RepID=UPI0029AC172D